MMSYQYDIEMKSQWLINQLILSGVTNLSYISIIIEI